MAKQKPIEGWGYSVLHRKAHYFVDSRSLCGQWVFGGKRKEGNDDSDHCARCKRRLKSRRAR
jgi:hypothetical protein